MRLCLFGASPDTRNLGVTALGHSVIQGILRRCPEAELTVFDYGRGVRSDSSLESIIGKSFDLCGASNSKRIYRAESYWNIRMAARMGGMGNPAAQRILSADAVLDISGGDSFTDLYGPRRFQSVTAPKHLAIEHGIPLVLLPQTYGPFHHESSRTIAAELVQKSSLAWARDLRSYEILLDLAGPDADPSKYMSGVDVAFALPKHEPEHLPPAIRDLLADEEREVAGFNVSGLIYHDPDGARDRYGFKADYRALVHGFLERLLCNSNATVLLVPHVLPSAGHYESDPHACDLVADALRDSFGDRVVVVPPEFQAGEMKWIIAQTDWFCGTRMHSAIAGLSSGVPTAAIAYSPKTLGVFETAGQADHVTDPRSLDTETAIESVLRSWEAREEARVSLRTHLPRVLQQAERQMDRIVSLLEPDQLAGKEQEAHV
ncbi:MAG: polysaccharide pyruvyl transferase family protein [Phycisphaerales bacterium]